MEIVKEPERLVPVVETADVVVIGGGPAGFAAAIAAAQNGASVTLVEKEGYLGGLATGGLVLLWDDMSYRSQKVIGGVAQKTLNRLQEEGGAIIPPEEVCYCREAKIWRKWGRWGLTNWFGLTPEEQELPPLEYSASVDPEMLKYVMFDLAVQAGVKLRMHSFVVDVLKENNQIKCVFVESKAGRQAVTGKIFIDASGDGDVIARAGADHIHCKSSVTLIHKLANVDTELILENYVTNREEMLRLDAKIKANLGVHVEYWWMKTTGEGIVWCNCPTFTGVDPLNVEEITQIEIAAREKIIQNLRFLRSNVPGFANAYLVETAAQLGVRQSRLLCGKHEVTVEEVRSGHRYPDAVGRARNYYIPYRALQPKDLENLLVAGRCYSAKQGAQFISREIAPCMVMGEAAGTAAAMAIRSDLNLNEIDISSLQQQLIAQGVIL